ncbi:MAG: hypothetical protein RJQ00_03435 [Vicingaceae bacterium]
MGVLLINKASHAQFYNGTQTPFGKNRVQYDNFEWQFYRFENFETYFYTGGKDLAVHTANYANTRIKEIEKFLDFYLDERIQFVVYNKQSHFRQSNIGLSTNENYNIGGVTNIVGSKVFIYFEGDYEMFNQQIDAGILRVLTYQMIYGGNWREVLRNSALLHLPDWYINGLISYLSKPNDPLINTKIKDGIINEDFKHFNALANDEATIAGHAMWKYIAETYGNNVISNILYMTRISREIEDGFLYVIGVPFDDLYNDWITFYRSIYLNNNNSNYSDFGKKVDFKVRKNRKYQNFIIDPKGKYIAYSTNKMGQYKIYLYDIEADKTKKLFKDEHKLDRIQDYSYPTMAWHPSGSLLTFITEEKGDILFHSYNIEEEDLSVKPIFKMEKVLSYDYLSDGRQFVFSGVNKGQSDLYIYNVLGNTQQKLTDDVYDDLGPVVSDDDNKIFFISNRINDSLNQEGELETISSHEKDVFVFDLLKDENPISSVTDTDEKSETNPLVLNDEIYYLVHDGINSIRYEATFDSSIARIDTTIHYNFFYSTEQKGKYSSNILGHASGPGNTISQMSYNDNRYTLYQKNMIGEPTLNSSQSPRKNSNTTNKEIEKESFLVFDKVEPERKVDIYNYEFNSSSSTFTKKAPKPTITGLQKSEEIETLDFPTQRIYRLNFRPDQSVLQLNNTFINGQYQLYNGGPYINSGIGVNTKIGIIDLMEDHRIYGGFRYAGDLIEYSLSYQNLKRRLDKEYIISRTRERVTGRPLVRNGKVLSLAPYDVKTLRGVASFIWPFSEVTSIRGVASVRNDKVVPLSGDRINLELDIFNEYWGSVKAAYVYDNTRNVALNIRYGTRFKIFAEQYQLLYSESDEIGSSDLTVVGFDFRHYQKIHREFIYVGRVAGSSSFGSNPLVYYLGGVDEWWRSDIFDESTPISQTQNYGFQALAANMRGFFQNVRNGNNFVVINNELRLPVFSYLINRPIQSDFVRNFQVIGFGDIGTAWAGESPFADDNPLNNETITRGPITVTYENINDPVVGGFGFGLRTTLLGYFVRADWGWGVENGEVNDKSLFMFSLSLDI